MMSIEWLSSPCFIRRELWRGLCIEPRIATCTTTLTASGPATFTIVATYAGESDFSASTSQPFSQSVVNNSVTLTAISTVPAAPTFVTSTAGDSQVTILNAVALGPVLTSSPSNLALSGLGSGASRSTTITNNSANDIVLVSVSTP